MLGVGWGGWECSDRVLDPCLVASELNAQFILIFQLGGGVQVHSLECRLGVSVRLQVWLFGGLDWRGVNTCDMNVTCM